MQEENISGEKQPARGIEFLLCDITGNVELATPEGKWVPSPIQCIDRAVDENPRILVVRFGEMPIREREALVGLCAALKRNSHTQKCPVLALLHSKHRKLIEDLEWAKVDYVRYIGDARLDSILMREILKGLGSDDRLERHLSMVCSFLHYSKIDSIREMTVCGAYLDRMVLGGRRLHEICETRDHLHCEYYLNPRPKS